ncbi:hypothetical protein [Mycobacterium sp. E796]|uniref:hypothetical protein n=1 Tax=Mycobacterium sp. E796 TaxID=1834151 RepID=UPI000A8B64A4|nr:hypothetical protein [Mycobacterium sp. E796]
MLMLDEFNTVRAKADGQCSNRAFVEMRSVDAGSMIKVVRTDVAGGPPGLGGEALVVAAPPTLSASDQRRRSCV